MVGRGQGGLPAVLWILPQFNSVEGREIPDRRLGRGLVQAGID